MTIACKAPLSMGFSRQEYWSGFPCPPPGDLPDPGIKPRHPSLQVDSLPAKPPGKPKNTGIGSLSFLQGSGIEPGSPALQANSLPVELPGKPHICIRIHIYIYIYIYMCVCVCVYVCVYIYIYMYVYLSLEDPD